MAETLSGVIERITFHNLDNGYCVLRVQSRGHRDLITVVGHLSQAIAGEFIEASGEWQTDRQHGQQFKAAELRTTPPHTAAGIAKYLGSGLVKGIGPKYAAKIVEVFGERTLDVIEKSPAFLKEVKGLGPKRIEQIRESWKQNQAVHKIMTFLQSFGIGTARAVRIYKQYGETAIEQVRQNPYRLSTDIWGVGFRTADELALKLGIPRDSPKRAQAAVRHILSEGSSNGHVGLPEQLVVEQTVALTQIPGELISEAIDELHTTDEIVRDSPRKLGQQTDANELTEPLLYLKPLFLAELGVARGIKSLRSGEHPLPAVDADQALAWVESKMTIEFAERQREAVRQAITQKVLVLTGGPGTGKTTIVRAIIEIFAAKGQKVGLCAPTGRAAKRLQESTGRDARTVHRLLEFDAGIGTFKRNKENPLDLELLVIDETSMMDVVLMNQLLRAVPPWACVVLVGDRDQLPSVGAGSVLADLIDSEVVPVVRLTEVHRQASSSWIVRAAHAVNHGEEPESAPAGHGDFYFVEAEEPATILDRIVTMVKERIPAKFGLDPFRDVQVLSPMNKSELGVANINIVLQAALNPNRGPTYEVSRFGVTFRQGDKVIQTQNNYQREVFNGDIGRILNVDSTDQILTVEYDGRPVEYEFTDLDELQLAFCTSIHKSQGSEYPAVVIPLHGQHYIMLQRNLLYTGITRGRKLVAVVGSRKALWRAVNTISQSRRFSLLKWRLQQPEA
jgi:exodeoxyribonuclease V alpha subunit